MYDFVVRIVLPLVGICFIAFAIIWNKLLSGRKVIDLTAEKLGLILKADAFGFVVFTGLLMIGAGIFFLYSGYEKKVESLENERRSLEAVVRELKTYDVRLNLVFQDPDAPNPFKLKSKTAFVLRKGERDEKPYQFANFEPGFGGIVVTFEKLTFGDTLYVVVETEEKKWRSDNLTAPGAHLMMHLIQ